MRNGLERKLNFAKNGSRFEGEILNYDDVCTGKVLEYEDDNAIWYWYLRKYESVEIFFFNRLPRKEEILNKIRLYVIFFMTDKYPLKVIEIGAKFWTI